MNIRYEVRRVRREGTWRTLMRVLGDNTVGNASVPTSWRLGRIREPGDRRELGLRPDNDAFGLIGWWYYDDARAGDEPPVAFSLSRGEAHRLAWWIVRWWASEWFGLRRRLYYAALHRQVASYRRRLPERHPEP